MTHDDHAVEAKEKWGHTDAYRESEKRAKGYSAEQWAAIKAAAEATEVSFAEALEAGVPVDGDRAVALAEEARVHIDRWFYPCTPTMHAALADMYTSDERFRAHYDDRADGLAEYVAGAIRENLARHGE